MNKTRNTFNCKSSTKLDSCSRCFSCQTEEVLRACSMLKLQGDWKKRITQHVYVYDTLPLCCCCDCNIWIKDSLLEFFLLWTPPNCCWPSIASNIAWCEPWIGGCCPLLPVQVDWSQDVSSSSSLRCKLSCCQSHALLGYGIQRACWSWWTSLHCDDLRWSSFQPKSHSCYFL